MKLASKIILRTPISDERLLANFVEQCLHDQVSLVAVHGPNCQQIEEAIDWLIVGDGSDSSRFLSTTSHLNETLEDVICMVECWEMERGEPFQEITL